MSNNQFSFLLKNNLKLKNLKLKKEKREKKEKKNIKVIIIMVIMAIIKKQDIKENLRTQSRKLMSITWMIWEVIWKKLNQSSWLLKVFIN